MRLNRPRPRAAFRFERLRSRWSQPASEREIGESLLRDIGMLVLPIRADRVERLDPIDADDAAEDVRLLKVNIDELSGLALYVVDSPLNMNGL